MSHASAHICAHTARRRGSAAEPLLVHTIGHAGGVEPPESPLIALPTSLEDRDAARRARRQLTVATVLCFIFMGAEVVGGYYANSLAIMTDAAHLLSDVAGLLISLFSLWYVALSCPSIGIHAHSPCSRRLSTKSPTIDVHTFGFHRVEIIGALAGVLLIWALTGGELLAKLQHLRRFVVNVPPPCALALSACLGGYRARAQPRGR